MKVQDVKKECLAKVGLSVEFSNSEVSTLGHLLTTVTEAVILGEKQAHTLAKELAVKYSDDEKIPCAIDLKTLNRIKWLLVQLTRRDMSGLFEEADAEYRYDFERINDIPSVKITKHEEGE